MVWDNKDVIEFYRVVLFQKTTDGVYNDSIFFVGGKKYKEAALLLWSELFVDEVRLETRSNGKEKKIAHTQCQWNEDYPVNKSN